MYTFICTCNYHNVCLYVANYPGLCFQVIWPFIKQLCFSCAFCLRQKLRKIQDGWTDSEKGGALIFLVPVYCYHPQWPSQSCSWSLLKRCSPVPHLYSLLLGGTLGYHLQLSLSTWTVSWAHGNPERGWLLEITGCEEQKQQSPLLFKNFQDAEVEDQVSCLTCSSFPPDPEHDFTFAPAKPKWNEQCLCKIAPFSHSFLHMHFGRALPWDGADLPSLWGMCFSLPPCAWSQGVEGEVRNSRASGWRWGVLSLLWRTPHTISPRGTKNIHCQVLLARISSVIAALPVLCSVPPARLLCLWSQQPGIPGNEFNQPY